MNDSRRRLLACVLTFAAVVSIGRPAAWAAEDDDSIPPALTEYKGRQIAQTMHYTGALWLVRKSREREEDCEKTLANLGAKPGMTICPGST